MKRIILVDEHSIGRLKDIVATPASAYVSILSANSWVLFSASSQEYNRTFAINNSEIGIEQKINYRIPREVMNLLMISSFVDKGLNEYSKRAHFDNMRKAQESDISVTPSAPRNTDQTDSFVTQSNFIHLEAPSGSFIGASAFKVNQVTHIVSEFNEQIGQEIRTEEQKEQFKEALERIKENQKIQESSGVPTCVRFSGIKLFLVMEEVVSKETNSVELALYWRLLNYDSLIEELKTSVMDRRSVSELILDSKVKECFRIPRGQEYDFEPKLTWFAKWLNKQTKKYELNILGNLRYLTDVSKMFKTGIYLTEGLAYTDNSKTGIEMYRKVNYFGPQMLFTHGCINGLADFARSAKSPVYLTKCGDYVLAMADDAYIMSWRNIRFNMDSNIDDLRRAKDPVVYETDYELVSKIFNNISVNKASQVKLFVGFKNSELIVTDTVKGQYEFPVPFECIAGYPSEKTDEVQMNFNILKSIFSIKAAYNTIRFFIYKKFIRIDLINKVDQLDNEYYEDSESSYDSDNKMILVVGKV